MQCHLQAQPVPKDILGGVQGVPEKRPRELTNPSSPAITKRRRMDLDMDTDEVCLGGCTV